jgi:hypothetical protein
VHARDADAPRLLVRLSRCFSLPRAGRFLNIGGTDVCLGGCERIAPVGSPAAGASTIHGVEAPALHNPREPSAGDEDLDEDLYDGRLLNYISLAPNEWQSYSLHLSQADLMGESTPSALSTTILPPLPTCFLEMGIADSSLLTSTTSRFNQSEKGE